MSKVNSNILNILVLLTIYFFFNPTNSNNIKKKMLLSSYIKGINLADANGEIIIDNNQLNMKIEAYTVGVFNIFSNFEILY